MGERERSVPQPQREPGDSRLWFQHPLSSAQWNVCLVRNQSEADKSKQSTVLIQPLVWRKCTLGRTEPGSKKGHTMSNCFLSEALCPMEEKENKVCDLKKTRSPPPTHGGIVCLLLRLFNCETLGGTEQTRDAESIFCFILF